MFSGVVEIFALRDEELSTIYELARSQPDGLEILGVTAATEDGATYTVRIWWTGVEALIEVGNKLRKLGVEDDALIRPLH